MNYDYNRAEQALQILRDMDKLEARCELIGCSNMDAYYGRRDNIIALASSDLSDGTQESKELLSEMISSWLEGNMPRPPRTPDAFIKRYHRIKPIRDPEPLSHDYLSNWEGKDSPHIL